MKRGFVVALVVLALVAGACSSSEPAPAPTSTTSTSVANAAGLSFSEFVEESYARLAMRSPQALTSNGTAAAYGFRNDRLDDLSPGFLEETRKLETATLEQLRGYERSIDPSEQTTYDLYEWYLSHLVNGHEFAYHDYPLHHFVNSYNVNLLLFLTEEHPIDSPEDAEDYIARLSQIDSQVDQLIEGLRIRHDLGVIPTRDILNLTVGRLRNDIAGPPETLALYTTFAARLAESGIEDDGLLEQAKAEIAGSFVPAWERLIEELLSVRDRAGDDPGVWRLPDGDAYYAYLVADHTTADITPDETHAMGLAQVERVEGELRESFARLGYPADAPIGDLLERAAREAGSVGTSTSEMVARYEALIAAAEEAMGPLFTTHPQADVVVIADPGGGGFYVPGSADGSRPGAFHAGTGPGALPAYLMPTVAYHEAIPGHHLQVALSQEMELPAFRRFAQYNGFVEGWALYAERLAAEAGLYEDDPYGDIGRLELELVRAVRLVVDSGIHHLGWSAAEARAYMEAIVPRWANEVDRYTVLPGQATSYMVGQQQILELREELRSTLGDTFDLAAFHDAVVGQGAVPLALLDELVADRLRS